MKNRYHRSSKLSEQRFKKVIRAFVEGATTKEAAEFAGISVRTAGTLLTKLRIRLYKDKRMSPMRSTYAMAPQLEPDNQFWVHYRECLYDCPSLKMTPYPRPISKPFHRHGSLEKDWDEWCGLCGILLHRRHRFWGPLEGWSKRNNGLSQEHFAYHANYVAEIGYIAIVAEVDWYSLILDVLKSDPL
jgi:hypothetical protein